MPSLKDIRIQIQSTKNTQQITRAMKMVSAAKLKRAQDNIVNVRPYAHRILNVIADIAATRRVEHPLLSASQNPQKILLVVLTSDRGLCGGFNNNISRFAEGFYKNNKNQFEKLDFLFVGKKARDYFRARNLGVEPIGVILNLAKDVSYGMAAKVADQLMKYFLEGHYDEIRLVYNEFKSAMSQEVIVEKLLPVDLTKTSTEHKDGELGFAKDMIFEPKPELIIEELLEKHFSGQVYRAMSESVAAEHAARMTAMENATKNAEEMIRSLTLTSNKLRQASITTELIEICSGAEALKG